MRITRQEVEHVARLARLALSEGETEKLQEEVSSILDNIAVLNEVDTQSVPPTAQVTGLSNVMREDGTWQSLPAADVLANAPRRLDDFFLIQPVFEDSQGESEG